MLKRRLVVVTSIAAVILILAAVFATLQGYSKTRMPDNSSSAAGQEDKNVTQRQIKNIIYNAKFECGTIEGNEGPLRPGHYDTDIGIFNKQNFDVKVQWSATPNNGKNTNSILKTLLPQGATSIVCKDLRQVIGAQEQFVEGFVIINVPVEPGLLGSLSNGSTILGRMQDVNVLDVQAFYTANALDELPHNTLVDKITFKILNDTSGKIPTQTIGKVLDISLSSVLNEISSPEEKVKDELAMKYKLGEQEISSIQIEITNVIIGVGTMIDDHAISLSKIEPQASR